MNRMNSDIDINQYQKVNKDLKNNNFLSPFSEDGYNGYASVDSNTVPNDNFNIAFK